MRTPAKTEFIGHLDTFPGVAILAIMGAHAWSGVAFASDVRQRDPDFLWLHAANESVFHGATLFFALIAGLLFTRVLR